ncbi:Uncharacterised protein [Mycobacterium tuberculosis]|nr:Uncharacterised protein [Mycobacterium tuberculosis]CKU03058.1 Uncharacterised protein [Mycobacterium tuberculosis]CKU17554.1 Uncharacterised protein [Mycobacterium tuberculosis]CNV28472.1 Uncharacterised protein [Mycobacterium tuberculosis]COW94736.1 Uncharacterised protein [Mycobacterium tuberculosis]
MPARALLKQPRQERFDRMDRAPQVDVDHPTPVVVRHLHDRTADNDAGVAEYDIDVAEQAESLVREVSDLFSMPDVAHHAVHIEPLGTQVVHRLPKSRLVNVP